MKQKQKLKELLDRLKNRRKAKVKKLNDIINEFETSFVPAGDEDGSNPPHGPGTPP